MVRLLTAADTRPSKLPRLQKSDLYLCTQDAHEAAAKPFTSEHELVQKFRRVTKKRVSDEILCASEIDSGNGVADIVLLRKRKDWGQYSSVGQLKPQWIYPFVALPYRRSFDSLAYARLACVTQKTADRVLQNFQAIGYCKRSGSNWIKWRQPRPAFTEILAIEAKIKEWRRALTQAARYLDFAHQSWVLLDSHYAKPAIQNAHEFRARNIGLLTIDSKGNINELISSSKQSPRSAYRYWYVITNALKDVRQFR